VLPCPESEEAYQSQGAEAYLVTGGAGFIGSHLVQALLQAGARVRVLDNFSSGRRSNLDAVSERIELIEGDVRDQQMVREAVCDVHYVIHQAAQVSAPQSVDDPITTH